MARATSRFLRRHSRPLTQAVARVDDWTHTHLPGDPPRWLCGLSRYLGTTIWTRP